MTDEVHPKRVEIHEIMTERDESVLLADGYDNAIIGHAEVVVDCEGGGRTTRPVVVYDYNKAIECLMDQGMDHEGAVEFFSYNTERSLMYEQDKEFQAPIFVYPLETE